MQQTGKKILFKISHEKKKKNLIEQQMLSARNKVIFHNHKQLQKA